VRDLESILDEALAARVPHHRLTGHYRSRHESLICFSNHTYYEGALVAYPSTANRSCAPRPTACRQ
jgi:superfamily I DNA and/or RNA helicase